MRFFNYARADSGIHPRSDSNRACTVIIVLKLAADADHHTSLTYDPYTSELTLDRSYAGSRADIVHRRSCKVRSQNGALKLRILLDKNSIEVFANDGEQTMTACIYTPQSADGITFAADGKATVTVEQFELNL